MVLPVSRVSARINSIAESATMKVDAKAKALKAAGEDVIGYGAGEPDFPTPEHIVEAASAAVIDPKNHKYTPAAGLPELREAIAEKTSRDSDYPTEPSQVLVTNGGKQAVYTAFAALLDPGDEVLLPAPYWTTYPETIKLAGGVTKEVFAGADQGFKVTVDQLNAAVSESTKALVFVSPSNPTGAVYTPEETQAIGEWAAARGLWVITDEIYEKLTYDDTPFSSIAAVPELAEQVVIVSGVAKTYAMTGWRLGWMVGPADVIKAATTLQTHLTSNVSNISQRAALAALTGPTEPIEQMRQAFDQRRKDIVERLNRIAGFTTPVPQGAFYVYVDARQALGVEVAGSVPSTTAELAELILEHAKVAVVPGEAFGPSGYLRLSYALGDEDLAKGIARIENLLGTKEP